MNEIFVSGLVNIETTLKIESFPIRYAPVLYPFHGINTAVSGVGYNVTRALSILGNRVTLISYIGRDLHGKYALREIERTVHTGEGIISPLQATPQSIILYDKTGRRQIHVDLKDIQKQIYPLQKAEKLMRHKKLAVLCNINFSRPLLFLAKKLNIPIATDVHDISSLEDEYNRDFMQNADILFLSDEKLPSDPYFFLLELTRLFKCRIIIIGMHEKGALMYCRQDEKVCHVPAVKNLPVVNTIGAGDALFSCFIHFFLQGETPEISLRKACFFAACKIGSSNASEGFLTEKELNLRYQKQL